MSRWDNLVEAAGEKSLRELERRYKSSDNAEDARDYIVAARRRGATRTATYFGALWTAGERPSNDDITTRSIALQDAIDSVVIAISEEAGSSMTAAGHTLHRLGSGGSNIDNTMHRLIVARAADKADFEAVIKHYEKVLSNKRKIYIDSPASIDHLQRTLNSFKELVGQE